MGKIKIKLKEIHGVHCILGHYSRFGERFTFCLYHVDGLLIDTGPSFARKEITEAVDSLGSTRMITLTHFHEDHSGNAAWFAERYEIPVYMSERTAETMRKPQIPFYRRRVWGDLVTVVGKVLGNKLSTPKHEFDVFPTPGHSHDHVSFVAEQQGWLFSGDLFLNRRLHFGTPEESVPELIQSIDRALSYSFQPLFCGHSGVSEHGREALEGKKQFLVNLREKTVKLSEKGYTGKQIARKLLPRQLLLKSFSGGELSPVHLIRSIVNERQGGNL